MKTEIKMKIFSQNNQALTFLNYYFLEEEIVIYCIIIFFETKALTKHIDRKKEPTKNKDVLPIPEKET